MTKAMVVGGGSGIGLSVVVSLIQRGVEHVYIVDKGPVHYDDLPENKRDVVREKTSYFQQNLTQGNYDVFEQIQDIDTLFISAGFGRVARFEDLAEPEIDLLIECNELAVIQIIKRYYRKLASSDDFRCGVMVSICGHVASPLFSVYGAAKTGVRAFVESINSELAYEGYKNRILDISPGSISGTRFAGNGGNIESLLPFAEECIAQMERKELLYIPLFDEIYGDVIRRYQEDYLQYGMESYQYKADNNRIPRNGRPQIVIGFLQGTFDLFHIGHLNLLRRAKAECDYLIVGVHESGAWKGKETFIPFEERLNIIASCRYVDEAIKSFPEDMDGWPVYHYHKLFVGSDYKGSERFRVYEEYFADKDCEIVYFPYTTGTSSTQLREALSKA